jgi:hypothetical protein
VIVNVEFSKPPAPPPPAVVLEAPLPPPATIKYSITGGFGVIFRATPEPIEMPLNVIAILFILLIIISY